MELKKGETIYPGIEEEVALEQAKGTISNVIDAVIELTTNSDDSYLSLENEGLDFSGDINIYIERQKGGSLLELRVSDEATGMKPEVIKKILCYGKRTSKIYEGINVRGFFGRGLKESIIALGEGEIISISDGIKTHGKYFWDYTKNKLAWQTKSLEKTKDKSGTTIIIKTREDENVDCPTFNTIVEKISNHFALREILKTGKRRIKLTFKSKGYKKDAPLREELLKYVPPTGQQIENKKIFLKGFGVIWLKLFESNKPLDYTRNDPGSLAGILIKTTNATLDNQLFGFDNDTYAHYFFGEIRSPGIAEKIRESVRGLIKPDRTGLNWRHEYCKELELEAQKVLAHHIQRKRKQEETITPKVTMPKERLAKINNLVRKLNKLSKELLGEFGIGPGTIPSSKSEISHLEIYPSEAFSLPNDYRKFTIYNKKNTENENEKVNIILDEPKGKFELPDKYIILKNHKKMDNLLIGSFKIKGYRNNDSTGIIVKQGIEEDIAELTIGEGGKRGQKNVDQPEGRKGGLFSSVTFDTYENDPLQRVFFNRRTGEIRIYVKYPGIYPYLKENGDGSESDRGSILLSELVAEAFCKETARRKVESDIYAKEAKLDKYLQIYNEHLRQCIQIIHSVWVG